MVGRTVTIGNDGIETVNDALDHYFAGNVPTNIRVQVGGTDVTSFDSPVRDGDVILVREGEFARKQAISGATAK
jgi:hypothetical protein